MREYDESCIFFQNFLTSRFRSIEHHKPKFKAFKML
jgi:hypothetical protein